MSSASRLAVLATCSILVLASVAAGAAASPQRVSAAASLCSVAKGVRGTLEKAPSTGSLTTAQGQALFKHNLGELLAARSALISAAPASLKANMRQAIGVFALFKTDLTKVKYNFGALVSKPTMVHSLSKAITKAEPAFRHLKAYFTNTCHFKG
jgi:hypothetical protein